jgi:hypothetical protein
MSSELPQEREVLQEADIQGLKYFRKLWPLFERLHDVGCQRDKARNRRTSTALWCCCFCSTLARGRFARCSRRPSCETRK